jgi:photosystem II stability/assembly factor-like uncharacterized protein
MATTGEVLEALEWRCIGPHRGGRVTSVAGHPTDKATFYFGACAGGVWKTSNAGSHWENISDGYFGTAAIGALAVAASDPNVIYAGTGEATIRGNVSHGDGVYRSTDGGRSWKNVGLNDTRHIGKIVVHPQNPDLVYVAALGHAFGPNTERGIFRSRDGGSTWEQVLFKSEHAGSCDIAMDLSNPRILYANIWEARRYPWKLVSGSEACGIWRSFDGGDTWEELTPRLRRDERIAGGLIGKTGLAASPARPGRVWALVEHEQGALYRSDDYGDSWTRLSEDPELRRRAWYYMHVVADPDDAETVWVLNMRIKKSSDGGRTFDELPVPHGDNHALWIDPENTKRIIEGNDGGACISYDGGRTWSTLLNQPTAQFYHVTTDHRFPYRVYGSQQDNWAISVPSIAFDGAISWRDWEGPGGGESGYIAVQEIEPHLVVGGAIGNGTGPGKLIAYDPRTGHHRDIAVHPEDHGFGVGADAHRYRFQWTFPIQFSPHDPNTLYVCSNHLHRSVNGGLSWEAMSPDLTRNEHDKQQASGLITKDNSGVEIYNTIFAFVESPHQAGLFWVGSDDGRVHISRDNGQSWQDITPPDLPQPALISIIDLSAHDPGTAYLAATRYKVDDTRPYLYKTADYGQTWTSIASNLPETDFTRVVREDPHCRGLLYAGTETGLYASLDDGGSWSRLNPVGARPGPGRLPIAPVHDLVIKGTDLVVATHGRSFWILDDVTPLRELARGGAHAGPYLFKPRPTLRLRYNQFIKTRIDDYLNYAMVGPVTVAYALVDRRDGGKDEQWIDAGKNPPDGVIVRFDLGDEPPDQVKFEFMDEDGVVLRTLATDATSDANKLRTVAGLNRLIWDMRGEAEEAYVEEGQVDIFRALLGAGLAPKVIPGSYRVRLTAGDDVREQAFEILPDPRLPATLDDLREQFELMVAIRDKVSDVNQTLNRLRRIERQLDNWAERAREAEAADAINEHAQSIRAALAEADDDLWQDEGISPLVPPNRLREKLFSLARVVDSADAKPTEQSWEVYRDLARRVDQRIDWLEETVAPDIEAFGARLQEAGVSTITDR